MIKTNIKSVYKIIGKKDITFYIKYKSLGKTYTVKAGKESEGMTPEKAGEILKQYKQHDKRNAPKKTKKYSLDILAKKYFEMMYEKAKEEEHLEYHQKTSKTNLNVRKEESIYKNFWRQWKLRKIDLNRINEDHVKKFMLMMKEQYSDKSIYNALALAKSIIKHTKHDGNNPFVVSVSKGFLKKKNARKRFLSVAEFQLLLNEAEDQLTPQSYLLVLVALFTGARPNSILHLKNKDIDFNNKLITFYDFKRKMSYTVPLPEKLIEPLQSHKKGRANAYVFYSSKSLQKKPMSEFPREIKRLLDRLFNRKIDIEDDEKVVVYTLRHTFANILLQVKKIPIEEVSHLLNHASIQTTIENYITMDNKYINSDFSDLA